MRYKSHFILSALCLLVLAGCSSSRFVLCVAPKGEFDPQSESELLTELNSQLPFEVPQKDFVIRRKASGLVGWAVISSEKKKDIAKAELKESAKIKVLQVEALTPEFEEIMKQQKK